ncbi:hypothetical protein FHG87_024346 [Trinorchestia longiramus]|nr:hypothetical protein FHG87_024346 [Trinorchestia longiramus]
MDVGVMQTKNEVILEQSAYTKALLFRFGMDKANSVATPVDINADPVTTSDEVEEWDKDLYQSAVEQHSQPRAYRLSARQFLHNRSPMYSNLIRAFSHSDGLGVQTASLLVPEECPLTVDDETSTTFDRDSQPLLA